MGALPIEFEHNQYLRVRHGVIVRAWRFADIAACCAVSYPAWCRYTDLSVSVTVRHPLSFFVAFANIKHQGSLSSVTSPPARQQPAIHKVARAVR